MVDTGMIRHVDDLGRIVIPMELRRTLGINPKDPMAISVEGERIILEKSKDVCIFCGNEADLKRINDRTVCEICIEDIKSS